MSATIALLATFVEVADASSFSRAAVTLGTTTATVSRDIARLEAEVGERLLHRTTRRVSLTTAGTALYERTATEVRALGRATTTLPRAAGEPAGVLKIAATYDLGATVLGPIVARFALRYPKVSVRAEFSSRVVDLSAEGFDVAIRGGDSWKRTDGSWKMRRLVRRGELELFAAPSYLARRGSPRALGSEDHAWLIPYPLRRLLALPKSFEPRVAANDFLFLCEIARAGGGVALLPTFVSRTHVATGDLVRVLPQTHVAVGGLMLLYPSGRPLAAKIAAFRDFATQAFDEIRLA